MKIFKTITLAALAALCLSGMAYSYTLSGEVQTGAVSNVFTYQGRLEKNGSPVSDSSDSATTFYFSVFNSLSGGVANATECLCTKETCDDSEVSRLENSYKSPNQCLWYSGAISTRVVSGVFSVSVEVPWQVFKYTVDKYLQISIQGQALSPRSRIASVPYALIAKKLEDNASIKVSSMSVAQDGNIYLNDGCIIFNNNGSISSLCAAYSASAIGSVQGDSVTFRAGTEIQFNNNNVRSMTIDEDGNVGIGTDNPTSRLTLDGDLGINGTIYGYDNSGSERPVVIGSSLSINNGSINNDAISIKEDHISFKTSAMTNKYQIYISSSGNVGIGTEKPEYDLHVAGKLFSPAGKGIKSGNITIGADAEGTAISAGTENLYLQKTGKLGIGTSSDNLPSKLVVEGGLTADALTVTGNTTMGGNVSITGPSFTVTNGQVVLSSTIINGSLTVNGIIGTGGGTPAYLDLENVFVSSNVFKSQVVISSDVYAYQRMFVGVGPEDGQESSFVYSMPFGNTDNYLQVGNGLTNNQRADVYILGGSDANSSIRFYHASNETARLSTAGMGKLNFLVSGSTVAQLAPDLYTVNTNFKVGGNTPAIYVEKSSVAINSPSVNNDFALKVSGPIQVDAIRFSSDGSEISSLAQIGWPSGLRSAGNVSINGSSVKFENDSSTVMTISNNRVGILTDNMKAALHVNGNVLIGTTNSPINENSGALTTVGSIYASDSIKSKGSIYTGGSERINASGEIVSGSWKGNTVGVAYGGTGKTTLGTGILKGNGTSITVGQVNLQTEVSNILPIANGGTGNNSFTEGPIRYDSSTNKFKRGAINLNSDASEVTGILGIANGGTRQNLSNKSGLLRDYDTFIGTGTVNLASSSDVTGILNIANGGTGRAADYTANGILYYKDGAISQVNLPSGKVLVGKSDGTPAAGTIAGENISVDTSVSQVIKLSIPQSVATTATPTFAGLRITGSGWTGHDGDILFVDASGNLYHSDTVDLSNLSGILPVSLGGTGVNGTTLNAAGPLRLYKTESEVHFTTGTINVGTEVSGILNVANGGTGYNASNYQKGDFLVANGTGTFTRMRLTDGQVFIGKSNDMPVPAQITGTANRITVTPGAGTITLSLPQDIHNGATPTFAGLTLTGLNGFIKANGSSALTSQSSIALNSDVDGRLPLANGGTGRDLSSAAGLAYNYGTFIGTNTVNLASADYVGTSVLRIDNGGTGRTSFPTGIVRYYSGTSLSTGAVRLAAAYNEVEGVLPIANGGTGANSLPTGIIHSNGTRLSSMKVSMSTEVVNILPVSFGGTGKSSLTANSVFYASAADAISELSMTKGQVLMGGTGGVPVAGLITGDSTTGVIVDTDTNALVKISLSQNVNRTATPSFAGITLTGITGLNPSGSFLMADENGSVYSVASIDLSNLTGILPVANGGTGRNASFFTLYSGPLYSYGNGLVSTGTINLETEVAGVLPMANGGTSTGTLAANGVVYSAGSNLESLVLDRGQLLIGVQGGTPIAASLTGGNGIVINGSDGAIEITAENNLSRSGNPTFAGLKLSNLNGILHSTSTSGLITAGAVELSNTISGVLPVANGGTGQNLYQKQGVLRSYGTFIGTGTVNLSTDIDGGSVLSVANGGTGANLIETSDGSVIKYSSEDQMFVAGTVDLSSGDVLGQLPVSRGGTGLSSISANSVLATGATDSVMSPITLSAGQIVMANNAGNLVAGAISGANGLTVSTTGTHLVLGLPQSLSTNDSPTFRSLVFSNENMEAGFIKVNNSGTVYTEKLSTATIGGNLSVGQGGTGLTSLTSGTVLLGNGTSPLTQLSLGANQILAGTGLTPSAVTLSGDGSNTNVSFDYANNRILISVANSLAQTSTPTFGGLILGGLSGGSGGVLLTNSEGRISSSAVLGTMYGGTGVSSFNPNSVIVSSNGVLSDVALAAGEFVIADASGRPSKATFTHSNGITVSTAVGKVLISAEQDLSPDANVEFSNLSVATLNAGGVQTGTLTSTGHISANTVSANSVSADAVVLQQQSGCPTTLPEDGTIAYVTVGGNKYIAVFIRNNSTSGKWYKGDGSGDVGTCSY